MNFCAGKAQAGFSLVELAIVMVVISLLFGSVFKGERVVDEARIQRMAVDFAAVAAAIRTYGELYHALPGDDPVAAARWPGARSGDGDGLISGRWFPADAENEETSQVWQHLRQAGLYPLSPKQGAVLPQSRVGGRMGLFQGGGGLALAICTEDVLGWYAARYDAQFDDGDGRTGRVRGVQRSVGGRVAETYDLARSMTVCTAM
ncbi:MAG: prepilin-type N-terminal cleavage/methylation domain-containing protein [Magnetococcus sp. XQGC-1]